MRGKNLRIFGLFLLSVAQCARLHLPPKLTLRLNKSSVSYSPGFSEFDADHQLRTARTGHTATLLADGRVLITGGDDGAGNAIGDVEVFDPADDSVISLTSLNEARMQHTATLLPNGKVLIVGGWTAGGRGGVELYDPGGNGSTQTLTAPAFPRSLHGASLVAGGKVLLTGGMDVGSVCNAGVELYDPSGTGSSQTLTSLPTLKILHFQATLPNGKVLIAGGDNCWIDSNAVYLYDASGGGSYVTLSTLAQSRDFPAGLLLPDGKVFFAGGGVYGAPDSPTASAEIYDPSGGGSATLLTPMSHAREAFAAALLPNGQVVLAGGCTDFLCTTADDLVELYDPSGSGTLTPLTPLTAPRSGRQSSAEPMPIVTLADGRVFLPGGATGGFHPHADFTLFSLYPTVEYELEDEGAQVKVEIVAGSGTVYEKSSRLIPRAAGDITIRATDNFGDRAEATLHVL